MAAITDSRRSNIRPRETAKSQFACKYDHQKERHTQLKTLIDSSEFQKTCQSLALSIVR